MKKIKKAEAIKRFSPGIVFDPSDDEIVSYFLPKLIEGNGDLRLLGSLSHLFKVCDVYSMKPSLLYDLDVNHNNAMQPPPCLMKGNERFFFSKREMIAQNNTNGKRPRRTLHQRDQDQQDGFWKSSTGEKPILDDKDKIIGYVNILNFYDYKNSCSGKKNRKDATKTSFIMYEYRLPRDRFQEWVVCKIKDTYRGEEDLSEAFWLDWIFLSDGKQRLAERESPPQFQFPACQSLNTYNLVELREEEAVLPLNFEFGYNGLMATDEQGGGISNNNSLMETGTERVCLGVDFADYYGRTTLEYGSQAETEGLQQQQAGYLNPCESISSHHSTLVEQQEEQAALAEVDGFIIDPTWGVGQVHDMEMIKHSLVESETNLIIREGSSCLGLDGEVKANDAEVDANAENSRFAMEIEALLEIEEEEKCSDKEAPTNSKSTDSGGEDDAEVDDNEEDVGAENSRFAMEIEVLLEIEEEEECSDKEAPASKTDHNGGEDAAAAAETASMEEMNPDDDFDDEVDLQGLDNLQLPDNLLEIEEGFNMRSPNEILEF